MLVRITEADDPRIAPYRSIREPELVRRDGGFVVEGEVVLRTAVREGRHPLQSVLLAQSRVEKLADTLALLPEQVPVYVAPQAVLDAIAGFPIHRGILALGRRASEPDPDALLAHLGPRAVVVGLIGVGNHDNMGGVFRNAAAFGAGAVLLDEGCCDPLYRKAIRTSVGAALTVPFASLPNAEAMLALLERHGFAALALSPSGGERLIDVVPPARSAVVLGAEGPGLPEAVMARTRTVRIPMAGAFDSLNVATTAGIVLHHLVFRPGAGPSEAPDQQP